MLNEILLVHGNNFGQVPFLLPPMTHMDATRVFQHTNHRVMTTRFYGNGLCIINNSFSVTAKICCQNVTIQYFSITNWNSLQLQTYATWFQSRNWLMAKKLWLTLSAVFDEISTHVSAAFSQNNPRVLFSLFVCTSNMIHIKQQPESTQQQNMHQTLRR